MSAFLEGLSSSPSSLQNEIMPHFHKLIVESRINWFLGRIFTSAALRNVCGVYKVTEDQAGLR